MADASDLRKLGAELVALGVALNGKEGQAVLKDVGKQLVPLGNAAVRADVGDSSMSGWAPTDPLRTEARVTAMALEVGPPGKQIGRWRVLTDGRGNRAQGPGVSAGGTTKRNKNGTVKRARKFSGRGNGSTRGKGTFDDASTAMERKAPGLMENGIVKVAEGWFRG